MYKNEDRAHWALCALDTFTVDTYGGRPAAELLRDHELDPFEASDFSTSIADLISCLGHLADRAGVNFERVVKNGVGMWSAEARHPDGDPYGNDLVHLIISPSPMEPIE